jgi:ATP-binding cassette subfamily B protein
MLIHPMTDLPNLFVTARQAFVSIDREEEILSTPVIVRREGTARTRDGIRGLTLDRVGFRYREELAPALDGVSLEITSGERIAVVGPVASGKSTLLRLMAGLLPAQTGRYSVDGRPFEEWDWSHLRARMGYVPQESLLFSETIAENVAFGRPAEADWVRRCLEIAQMGPDLDGMKEGLATQLGQRGTLVSGGQKQRIAIARALAVRPDILFLDDCTASLDAQNEDRFWTSLGAEFPRITVLLVSHRIATIRRADRVLVLDHGRTVDLGTHAELASRCQVYQEFLQTEERKTNLGVEMVETETRPAAGA